LKRFIPLLLALILLCGCHADQSQTTAPTTSTTQPTPMEYLPPSDGTIEELTQGAVQAYSLEGRSITGIRFFGSRLLAFSTDDHVELTTLLMLGGTELGILQSATLDCALTPDQLTLGSDSQTLAYYHTLENSIVLLDGQLAEIRRIRLPDQVTDRPVLSGDLATAYYCDGSSIYALDLESGLSRLLKQHSCSDQSLTALHFDDTVLEVFMTLADGSSQVAFISPENGETTGTDRELLTLATQDNHYLLQRLDGIVTETLVGQASGNLRVVDLPSSQTIYPAFSLNSLVASEGSILRLYDLSSGRISSQVDLGSGVQVQEVQADPAENTLWIRALDQQSGTPLLLRWQTAQTKISENTVYIHKRYTPEEPDTDGIAKCQQQADELSQKLGVTLVVDASLPVPQNYEYVPEHQVRALEESLARLEEALSVLPPEFLAGLHTVNQSGTVHIGLVRQVLNIAGEAETDLGGFHFVSAGDHYIVLTTEAELETAVMHQLCHVLDSYVFAHSTAYDHWDTLNPKGFTYAGSYTVNTEPDDASLQGQTQCFVSAYGMTYAKEDRAELFEAAMMPGNEALLSIPGLQNKLRYLCSAIRQAYDWEETQLTLPWEQYLKDE